MVDQSQEPISREEFRRWQKDRVTQRVFQVLKHNRQELMEGWAHRGFENDGSLQVAQGKAMGYEHAVNLTAEEIEPNLPEEKTDAAS